MICVPSVSLPLSTKKTKFIVFYREYHEVDNDDEKDAFIKIIKNIGSSFKYLSLIHCFRRYIKSPQHKVKGWLKFLNVYNIVTYMIFLYHHKHLKANIIFFCFK